MHSSNFVGRAPRWKDILTPQARKGVSAGLLTAAILAASLNRIVYKGVSVFPVFAPVKRPGIYGGNTNGNLDFPPLSCELILSTWANHDYDASVQS